MGFSPSLPTSSALSPATSTQGGGLGQAPRRVRRAEGVRAGGRLRPVGNLGKDPHTRPWERPAELGRDVGESAAGGQAGGAKVPKNRKRVPNHRHPGQSVGLIRAAASGPVCVRSGAGGAEPRAGALVAASVTGPAPQRTRARAAAAQGSPLCPGAPPKILSQLVSGARWAGSGLPAEQPYRESLSAPAQTMDRTRLRFRSASFASRNGYYRQVALTRCPLQAVVSAPPTSHKPPATRRDRPAQEDWAVPLIPCHHSAFPGRYSFAEAFLPLAPLSVRGSLCRTCPGRGLAARCPGCEKPDSDSGSGTGRSRKTCCCDPRGMRPFPADLRDGPGSGTSGSQLAAATFAGPLYLSRWPRFWLGSGPVALQLHAF